MNAFIKKDPRHHAHGTGELPKALFVIMALLGSIFVWVIKIYHLHYLIAIIVPVSFILLYCGLAWKTNLFYIREDQIGDNAYYMGFLFTLASLAYALFRFQTDHAKGGGDPADIIGSFGVALWSTIVGIALRVFFSQMRQDPQDIEKEARAKIAHAASMLSGDLYQASVTFNAYTRGLQQSVEEAFLKSKEVAANTIAALEGMNKKIETMETPDSIINRKIDGIFGNLEATTDKLNNLAGEHTQSVESVIKASTGLTESVKSLNSHIGGMKEYSTVAGDGTKHLQAISKLVNDLQNELGKLATGFSGLTTQQAAALAGITRHADELGTQLERSRKYTEETHDSLVSMTKTLTDKLQ